MSSTHASMHGGNGVWLATPARKTLAECLLEKGYWTGGLTANVQCGSFWGFHRGFAYFRDCRRESQLPPDAPSDWLHEWPRLLDMGIPPRLTQTSLDARELTDLGLLWLSGRRNDEPWFLWLHYLDPHWPCQMPPKTLAAEGLSTAWHDVINFRKSVVPSRGTFDPGLETRLRWSERYRESVAYTDSEIGRLLGELRKRPDWDRTMVAVTGDHGEELYERGTWHHSWNQLHREGTQVPLVIRIPQRSQRQNVSCPVSLLDLAPTLLNYAGIEQPSAMIGTSLRPMMEGQQVTPTPVFTEMLGHIDSAVYRLAIRDGEWKYIFDAESPNNSKLFQVSEDPGERVNLVDQRRDVFRHFEQLRLAHMAQSIHPKIHPAEVQQTVPEDRGDEIMRQQLEALGYL